jgi:hypothetical protein
MQQPVSDLKGYALGATDGEIGSVSDFLFDDSFWAVRYLVADTTKWLPGRRSRDQESAYFDNYGWPYYWVGGQVWGAEISPGGLAAAQKTVSERLQEEAGDTSLRSAAELTGYHIEATDGAIGHAEDLVIDDETWEVRYLIVDTQNWWPGKKVLVSPEWIDRISWDDAKVYVDLSRQAIQNSPEYGPGALDRTYEERLYEHYGRPPYWNS